MVGPGRHQAVCLTLSTLRALLVAAVPVSVGFLWVTAPKACTEAGDTVETTPTVANAQTSHELAWYAPLWQRDLKQPPVPPVVTVKTKKPEPPKGPVPTLEATLVDSQGRFAHLRDRSGRLRLRGIGDSIDRFVVRAIEPGRVQLEREDRLVWVDLPHPNRKGRR